MKPLAYLAEILIYIPLIAICGPYAVILYKMGYYGLSYVNAGATLFMSVMVVIAAVNFIKSLREKSKGKGSRFK